MFVQVTILRGQVEHNLWRLAGCTQQGRRRCRAAKFEISIDLVCSSRRQLTRAAGKAQAARSGAVDRVPGFQEAIYSSLAAVPTLFIQIISAPKAHTHTHARQEAAPGGAEPHGIFACSAGAAAAVRGEEGAEQRAARYASGVVGLVPARLPLRLACRHCAASILQPLGYCPPRRYRPPLPSTLWLCARRLETGPAPRAGTAGRPPSDGRSTAASDHRHKERGRRAASARRHSAALTSALFIVAGAT